MWRYLKEAFLIRPEIPGLGAVPVNVLACVAVAVLGFVFKPLWLLGLGLETAFVFTLANNPRFRAYVDARKHREARAAAGDSSGATLQRILRELPPESIKRFEGLRRHCLELQQVAANLRQTDAASPVSPLEEMQLSGLDRLLWVHLRLLFTQHMLERVFREASEEEIGRQVGELEEKLRRLEEKAGGEAGARARMRKALEDNLQTCRERQAHYQMARDRVELVRLELDRLENKIRSLGEMAVNRQEPEYVAGQVDQVASGMVQTEHTLRELQFATGLGEEDEAAPALLHRQVVTAGR
jgi:hypothetical protein